MTTQAISPRLAIGQTANQGSEPAVENESCLRIRQCYSNASEQLSRSCFASIIPYISVIGNLVQVVLNTSNAKIFHGVLKLLGYATTTTQDSWKQYTLLTRITATANVLNLVGAPFAINGIVFEAKHISQSHYKFESCLRIIENLGWLMDSVGTFIRGLYLFGAVSVETCRYAYGLYIGGAFSTIATVVLGSLGVHQNRVLLDEIDLMISKEGYEAVLKMIADKDDETLLKHFQVEGPKLRKMLREIPSNLVKPTVDAIRNRILANKIVNTFTLISAIVSIIGLALLLFTSLCNPAYLLLAIAPTLLIGRFFYDRYANNRFQNAFTRSAE
jgi:hypothetical protein